MSAIRTGKEMVKVNEERFEKLLEPYERRIKGSEDRKVYDQFFDNRTLMNIYTLMNSGIIETVDFPVATGKEGGVFKCTSAEGENIAMKVYRISNSTFRSLSRYIAGDERFSGIGRSFSRTVYAWAEREYLNLSKLSSAGLHVPRPLAFRGNVVVMSYLGNDAGPAPLLKDCSFTLREWNALYRQVIDFITGAYRKAHIIHSDLSQYNILVYEGQAYVIDCSQGVTFRHPNSSEFLSRDIANVNKFFESRKVKVKNSSSLMKEIVEGMPGAVSQDSA